MSRLDIDLDGPGPLHERIAGAVRRAVADGHVGVGETLPPARDLARTTDVNVNTVLRAYRLLRDEGVLELRRGRGAIVRHAGADRARLGELVAALLTEAAHLGLSTDELHRLLQERA